MGSVLGKGECRAIVRITLGIDWVGEEDTVGDIQPRGRYCYANEVGI